MKFKPLVIIGLTVGMVAALWLWRSQRQPPRAGRSRTAGPPSLPALSATGAMTAQHQALLAKVPDTIRGIFGWEGEPFAARLSKVHALGTRLSREEIDALYLFLHTTGPRPGTLIGGEHVLKNDILNTLRKQENPPPDLAATLCGLYRDARQDVVTRDYAVQHLISFRQELPTGLAATNDRLAAAEVRDTLWEAVTEHGSSVAGTALLGLHRLASEDRAIDSNQVVAAAVNLLQASDTSDLSRITAVQVCAQRRLREALPATIALARGSPSLAVRLSAIAAIGDLGGAPEQALLEELEAEGDRHLQPAVQSALKRLKQRLAPQPHQPADHPETRS